jgi:hypothetical protein
MTKYHHIPGEKSHQDSTWLVAIIMVGSELGMNDQYLTKMLQIDKIFKFFAQFNDWLLLRLGITCPIKFKLDLSMVIVCFV